MKTAITLVYPACLGFPLGGAEIAKHGEPWKLDKIPL